MSDFIHNRAPYRTANHAKKESSRSNLLRIKENPTATRPTVIDAAAINSRGSSIRKVRNTSSAVGCIFGYSNQWEKAGGTDPKRNPPTAKQATRRSLVLLSLLCD